jgi:hypothetical protein
MLLATSQGSHIAAIQLKVKVAVVMIVALPIQAVK